MAVGRCYTGEVAAPRSKLPSDPVVEAYKKDVDRTLLRANLDLSPEARVLQLQQFAQLLVDLREAGRKARNRAAS